MYIDIFVPVKENTWNGAKRLRLKKRLPMERHRLEPDARLLKGEKNGYSKTAF